MLLELLHRVASLLASIPNTFFSLNQIFLEFKRFSRLASAILNKLLILSFTDCGPEMSKLFFVPLYLSYYVAFILINRTSTFLELIEILQRMGEFQAILDNLISG